MKRFVIAIRDDFDCRNLLERVWILMLAVLLCCPLMAADGKGTVDMVSYEQRAVDSKATISLKNNTSETVHNVAFRLTYLDMDGTAIDYNDFVVDVDIEPGLTRKADIKAYEHERLYAYYKSNNDYLSERKFKLKYEYKGMNVCGIGASSGAADGDLPVIIGVLASMLGGCFYVVMFILVGSMARDRYRNVVGWVALSFVLTPFVTALILRCLGKRPVQYVYVERNANGRPHVDNEGLNGRYGGGSSVDGNGPNQKWSGRDDIRG